MPFYQDLCCTLLLVFFFQAEDGIRDDLVTGVQTCALPILIGLGHSGQNVNAQIGGDGSFDVPVSAGSWTLSLESETASSRNLVAPQISFNVTDGLNVSNINYVAQISTRTISGSVKSGNNTGIVGLNVFAGTSINGTNYSSNATTDSGGNYSMLSLPGVWSVGPDQQGLTQRGYGSVTNQNAD